MLLLTAFVIFGKSPPWSQTTSRESVLDFPLFARIWKEPAMEMVVEAPVAHEDRKQTAQRIANTMFHQQPDWIAFFREVLGVDGLLRKLFPTPEELAEFEKTGEYAEIQLMLAKLRERSGAAADGREPTRVITVRLPKSLHESLRAEAHDRKTSMNQLCISKLLQVIDAEMVAME
jgi:predicted HicB family RNase H-like nuclease